MTETGPLRDYSRSRAVLVGVANYLHLPPVPPARNSLERMAGLLTGPLCGWPKTQVKVLRNTRRRDRLPDRLMEAFDGVVDVALFYFVGHGQLYEDELCLALGESPKSGARCTTVGLPFSDVRAAMRACDAQTKIVILDCCFAGQAARPAHSLATGAADVVERTLGTGAFTMAASGAYRTAWFEADPRTGSPQTYFTKYFVDVVEQGIPGYPDGLPLGPTYARTADALARDRRPGPTRSVRHDADRFILAHNVAKPAVIPPALPESLIALPSGAGSTQPPTLSGPPDAPAEPASRRSLRRRSIIRGLLAAASGASLVGLRADDDHRPDSHLWVTLTGHDGAVHSVAFSPDGKILASGGEDGIVRLWDVVTRNLTATLTGHDGAVHSVAFSPDGTALASGGEDKAVLWDIATRSTTRYLIDGIESVYTDPSVHSVAFSPDGKTLAGGYSVNSANSRDGATVRLWDVATWASAATLTGDGSAAAVNSVVFSPDGKFLASGNSNGDPTEADFSSFASTVQLWDAATLATTATLPGNDGAVFSVVFSPDGKILASGGYDATVRLWDVAAQTATATLTDSAGEGVRELAFSPDGKILASVGNNVRLWDITTRTLTATFTGHTGAVPSVAFSPDARILASGGTDGTVRLWKLS